MKITMKKLLKELLAQAKLDKGVLVSLKHTAVKAGQYELAARLREIERVEFPESVDTRQAKALVREADGALRSVGIKVEHDRDIWLIAKAMQGMKNVDFSIKDAAKLEALADEYFKL